jgi:VWFA-related protein
MFLFFGLDDRSKFSVFLTQPFDRFFPPSSMEGVRGMRFTRSFSRTALALCLVFAVALSAQDNAPTPQPAKSLPTQSTEAAPQSGSPAIRTASNLVVVDVVVSDEGKPVKGLERQAFHIFEDGHEQAIKIFEEHNSADASNVKNLPSLPANTYSNFPETTVTSAANVLLLDALNTPMKDQMYVRKEMTEYLKNIPPGTRIAIFTLASKLRIVQGFTTDSTSLLAALSNKRNSPGTSPLLPDTDDATPANLVTGMQDGGASTQAIASLQQFQADEAAFQTDLRVQFTLDALNQLAGYLGGIPGRKNLIWFSCSFPLNLDPDVSLSNQFSSVRNYSDQLKATSDLLTISRVAVYPVDARGLFTAPMFSAANQGANYSGVSHGTASTPSPPNPGTHAGGGATRPRNPANGNASNPNAFARDNSKFFQTTEAEHATMQELAQDTGGKAFFDTNGIKEALANAIENGENYYTLAYIPDDAKFALKFRKIQAKLPEQNHHLAYRQGYFADAPSAHSSNAPLSPTAAAIQRGAPPSSQILFKVRVLPSDDPALKGLQSQAGPAGLMADKLRGVVKRYWIDYATDLHQVSVIVGSDGLFHCSLEFAAIAYDRDGKILNVANRSFKLNLQSAQYNQIIQTGLPLHQELDVPAGEVYLRIAVHDLSTDRIGSVEIPLQVLEKTPQK